MSHNRQSPILSNLSTHLPSYNTTSILEAIPIKSLPVIIVISQEFVSNVILNTHPSGSKRIGYIFCSCHIYKFITKCGILPFCSIVLSDHRGFFIDMNIPNTCAIYSLIPTKTNNVSYHSPFQKDMSM